VDGAGYVRRYGDDGLWVAADAETAESKTSF
jgi:hypothetical protein